MADVLEAMGFPSEWCERALQSTSGIEPAVELLLQWQANGAAPTPAVAPAPASAPAGVAPTLHLSGNPSSHTAVSTVTTAACGPSDAVVPDAYADERKRRTDAAVRQRKEQEAEKMKIRQHLEEDKANRQWRNQLAVGTPAVSQSWQAGNNSVDNFVELNIRCPGHPNMKERFSADATLKEVREFVLQQLQRQQLPLSIGMPSAAVASRRLGRPVPFSGASAALSSDREAQHDILQAARENFELQTNRIVAQAKSMRNGQSGTGSPVLQNQGTGTIYFLIPYPRMVFDTEASMETTLRQANLVPRGGLTVQFQSLKDVSSSEQVNISSEPLRQPQESINRGAVPGQPGQSPGENQLRQYREDVEKRAQRLKATVERLSERRYGESSESAAPAAASRPTSTPTPAPSQPVAMSREERSLEVDGERVRHRELALLAAAKRMSEAAQIFRDGLPPDEGEAGGGFHTPSDLPAMPESARNDGAVQEFSNLHGSRVVNHSPGNLDVKGKQAADCGPSSHHMQLAEVQAQDGESHIAGPTVRFSRARVPLSSPLLSRPEKLQRTHEAINTGSDEVNFDRTFAARGHAMDVADNKMEDIQETRPTEEDTEGSSSSGGQLMSELRIRLEDGNVVTHTFPAYTSLLAVCESVVPERSSTSEYGLIIPTPGSHYLEGEALNSTLQEVGLVPRGMVHLQKVASRGLVTQGRRRTRRGMRYVHNNDEPEPELEQLWQDFSRHMNPNLTYEELVELEDSIGRVNVGVPEEAIANMPTHIVARSDGDICIVCLGEMVEGEEVLSLPCVHTFHPACIRQWLMQSACCPTCKHSLT